MGLIQQLKDFATNTLDIFPISVTEAIYHRGTGETLDKIIDNKINVIGEDVEESIDVEDAQLEATTVGGKYDVAKLDEMDQKLTDLNGNLNQVSNSLNEIGTFELLASPTASGTVTVKNMSNYRYIYLEMDYEGAELAFDASMIPYGIFKFKRGHHLQCFGASASYKSTLQGSIQYVSDTSIKIILNDEVNLRPKIYGIK